MAETRSERQNHCQGRRVGKSIGKRLSGYKEADQGHGDEVFLGKEEVKNRRWEEGQIQWQVTFLPIEL